MISRDIITLLDEEVARNNTREFIADDPVQFPRRYDDVRDIEIVSLLVAAISWGRRPMILRDADRMLALMDHQPYRYMMEEGYEDLPSRHNIHRTFFASDLQWYLRGLREIYRRYGTLDDFALAHGVGEDPMPAWRLVEEMQRVVSGVNGHIPHDAAYHHLCLSACPEVSVVAYKPLFGECYSASALGFYVACRLLQQDVVPPHLFASAVPSSSLRPTHILYLNHSQNSDYAFALLQRL